MMDVELNSCFSEGEGKNRMVISFFFSGVVCLSNFIALRFSFHRSDADDLFVGFLGAAFNCIFTMSQFI